MRRNRIVIAAKFPEFRAKQEITVDDKRRGALTLSASDILLLSPDEQCDLSRPLLKLAVALGELDELEMERAMRDVTAKPMAIDHDPAADPH